jgi:tRNA-modifying protein YgfZ
VIDLDGLRASLPTAWLRTAERVVEVTGADRLAYLDATTSQSLAARQPGEAVGALVLDAHGLALAVLEVLVLEDRVLLVVPDDAVAATVLEILGGRTFLSDARFTLTDLEVLRVFGPAAAEVVTVPLEQGDVREGGGSVLARDAAGSVRIVTHGTGWTGGRVLDDFIAQLEAGGAAAGDEDDFTTWRVAHGVPAWGREIVAPHLPEELGLLPTHVHLAKGCYPGQETVARMWMLGRPRRRLAVLGFDGEVPAVDASGLTVDSSAVTSISAGQGLGLAMLSGVRVVGEVVGSGAPGQDGNWTVLRLPGDSPDPPGHDPAMRRRRDR